jgi:hypothetical protein
MIMLFLRIRKESSFNYRDNWLYVGVGCAFIRNTLFLIAIFNQQFLLNVNVRLVILFLMFAQYDYLILYFTKLRFKFVNRVSDKAYYAITQVLLFLLPFIFVASLMFGTNNLNIDMAFFMKDRDIISLVYQFPENKIVDDFIEIMMLCYFIISTVSLKPVFNKLKNRNLEITYVLFIVHLFLFYPYVHWDIFQKIISIFPLYHIFSAAGASLFYVFLGLFDQKGDIKQ